MPAAQWRPLDTVSSVDVNFAHRVTSREVPSLYEAVTLRLAVCPGDTTLSTGETWIALSRLLPSLSLELCGAGHPAEIQAATIA